MCLIPRRVTNTARAFRLASGANGYLAGLYQVKYVPNLKDHFVACKGMKDKGKGLDAVFRLKCATGDPRDRDVTADGFARFEKNVWLDDWTMNLWVSVLRNRVEQARKRDVHTHLKDVWLCDSFFWSMINKGKEPPLNIGEVSTRYWRSSKENHQDSL